MELKTSLKTVSVIRRSVLEPIQIRHLMKNKSLMQQIIPEDLMKFGLIPEFIGRLPILTSLEKLNEHDLVRILTEPKNALVKQYKKLMALDDVELEFTDEALSEMAQLAIRRNTGARGLRSIVEHTMMDVMYETPSNDTNQEGHYYGRCR